MPGPSLPFPQSPDGEPRPDQRGSVPPGLRLNPFTLDDSLDDVRVDVAVTPAGREYLDACVLKPITDHEAFMQRVNAGDPEAVAACEAARRWQEVVQPAFVASERARTSVARPFINYGSK